MKTNKNKLEQGAIFTLDEFDDIENIERENKVIRAINYFKMMNSRRAIHTSRETLEDAMSAYIAMRDTILNKGARYVN